MLTTTLSDFRKDMGVVIMSLDEYNSPNSTQHELSSRKNQKRFDEYIGSLNAAN